MANMEDARKILSKLGLPLAQQNEISALTLLSLCGLSPHDAWKKAKRQGKTVTKGVMDFIKEIAWETEVWIAEIPDHMIHFNGDHFMDHP